MTDQENVELLTKFLKDNNLTLKIDHILRLEQTKPVEPTEAVTTPDVASETAPEAPESTVEGEVAKDTTSN